MIRHDDDDDGRLMFIMIVRKSVEWVRVCVCCVSNMYLNGMHLKYV